MFKAIYYSLLARGYSCRLLKTFENLDSVQDQHNVAPDLDRNSS